MTDEKVSSDVKAKQGDESVVISSYLVDVDPECAEAVKQSLLANVGVEIHEQHGNSLMTTIEAATISASQAIATLLSLTAGVRSVQLVYANFEDDPAIRERLQK